MSKEPDVTNPLDPFGVWRGATDASVQALHEARDANMQAWSKFMIDFINSEAYSQATNQWLDAYLTASQPVREALEKTMTQALGSLNMPTRGDVTSLAQRLANVEMRLDDLDGRLDEIQRAIAALAAPKAAAEKRSKAKEAR
jgi:hypothetical protein